MRIKDMLNAYNEYREELNRQDNTRKSKVLKESAQINEMNTNIRNILEERNIKQAEFSKFSENVKKSLLVESLYRLYNKSIGFQLEYFDNEPFKVSLINKFVNEQGVDRLLNSFQSTTYLLSEMNRLVKKYHKIIIEKVDKNNIDSFVIDPEDRDNFFDELDIDNADEISDQIKNRVTNSIEEFIQNNINDKIEIKEIIQSTKEKISTVKDENLHESYEVISKKKISDVRNNRQRNILEQMIRNISESVIKDEKLRKLYSDEGKINMDKIVESSKLMYTFLEMCNTTKIIKVNENYISEILISLKS